MIGAMGELILLRHGETEWSRDGRHTGRTDIPLTPKGISGATALAPLVQRRVAGQPIVAVFTSPGQRAVKTAELAGLGGPGVPRFHGGAPPPGESAAQVGERVDRVLKRVAALLPEGDVALVAHGHVLRVLTARWLGLQPEGGRLFRLDTGTVSTLGDEHAEPVVLTWNVPPTS